MTSPRASSRKIRRSSATPCASIEIRSRVWAARPLTGATRNVATTAMAAVYGGWNLRLLPWGRSVRNNARMDFKLELVLLPVSDVARAKAFYTEGLGFNLDVDHQAGDDFRVVQVTPPGSACSVCFGVGIHDGPPGSVTGTHLVVTD